MNRYASIDIGTNTVLMVIADVSDAGIIHPIKEEQRLPRLGKAVDASRIISEDSVTRVVTTLLEYKRIAESFHVSEIFACGTSALRDAVNRNDVVDRIKSETGITVEIISGDTEAQYTYIGALSGVPPPLPENTGVLDIGGGSTELVIGNGLSILTRYSINIGAVRLTERYFNVLPPPTHRLSEAEKYLTDAFANAIKITEIGKLIGVAGTVTTLAAIDLNIPRFSVKLIDGHVISRGKIESIYKKYAHYSLDDMKRVPQIVSGREDILFAGIAILITLLKLLNRETVTVSTRGLRYGQLVAKKAF
jgi:exopolyphosphatase / guanosine-5'-triphosphate,3'-diphosphate pyrophosphatase